ncbi:sarcosine oxidase subunit gamma [Roseovarius atlanticus]|uniref:sarcosine oxidase subunit gamma n=1 Tax=Roseovarius atlanticus TaxID=1641875 RepID=UPI001C943553|nr:sarcosine oxidase subunit gamma family protein [Roseovarius atlanticus]MBY5988332.1 sarcosine oxidase subunit gamma [Roseovarius atlanticus]MBY6123723.1 sarcosine oxidase subunit gamma [Roseovarius atlanticus]MBY6148218.1 sarcosine oxidase subunit gamma [Roseovarius atlanticus]
MSKAVSALQGAVYQGYVEVREMGLQGMITLRGDLSSAKMKKAVKDACGVDLPGQREIAVAGDKGAAWMSPDELLLMLPYEGVADALAAVEKALSGEHFLAVNVSDARAVFQVQGGAAREIIAKLCPVDMAPGAFEPGQIRRTRMAQIAAAFWMVDAETIRVVCFRSVAEYAFNLLKDAAEPGGETGLFA